MVANVVLSDLKFMAISFHRVRREMSPAIRSNGSAIIPVRSNNHELTKRGFQKPVSTHQDAAGRMQFAPAARGHK